MHDLCIYFYFFVQKSFLTKSYFLTAEIDSTPGVHCILVLFERAINEYWREHIPNGKKYLIFNTEDIHSYTCGASKAIGKLMDQTSKLPRSFDFVDQCNSLIF